MKNDRVSKTFDGKPSEVSQMPRERIKALGAKALSNQELVAALLGTGTKERSVMLLASEILAAFPGGVSSFDNMSIEELKQIEGIGTGKACQLLAAVELGKRIYAASKNHKLVISSPSDAADLLMSELRYKKQEYFKLIALDTKNQVIAIETVTIGTLNQSLVHPREVFSRAIRCAANGIILAHNHPSGKPEPSREDILLTERLIESGKLLGIAVLDHVVIGDGHFYSFKEHGLL